MSQTQNPMEFPPLDGLKLWHLLQTHVSAGCGDTLKVNFDGNLHPPQHMQDLNVVYTTTNSDDPRLKMNSQVLHHHHNDKIPCSCPMCPMSEKKGNSMKPLEPPHLNAHPHPHHILHQPNNQNQQNNPQQQQQQQQQSHKLHGGPSQGPPSSGTSNPTTINCSVCHKKIRNTKKQQQAALRQPNYCPLCDKCSRSQKNLYNQNLHGSSHSHSNSQNNSSIYPHNSHNTNSHNNNNSHHTNVYSNSSSDRHSKASRGECGKQFKCSKCDKFFSNGGNLKRHLMIHTGEKPYTCHVCNKPFRTKTLLANHIRTHTGEKPYLCHLCEKKFSKSENLKRHVKIHVKHNIV